MSKALEVEFMKLVFYQELEAALTKVGGTPDYSHWKKKPLEEVLDSLIPNGVKFGVRVLHRDEMERLG